LLVNKLVETSFLFREVLPSYEISIAENRQDVCFSASSHGRLYARRVIDIELWGKSKTKASGKGFLGYFFLKEVSRRADETNSKNISYLW